MFILHDTDAQELVQQAKLESVPLCISHVNPDGSVVVSIAETIHYQQLITVQRLLMGILERTRRRKRHESA